MNYFVTPLRVLLFAMISGAALSLACSTGGATQTVSVQGTEKSGSIEFTDAKSQTREYIAWYESIQLTPEQEKIKNDALAPLAASCCSDNSLRDCCCPCNLSKSIWGLSKYAITRHNYDEEAVRQLAVRWVDFLNPEGSDGVACYQNRCETPFAEGGCGGMKSDRLVF